MKIYTVTWNKKLVMFRCGPLEVAFTYPWPPFAQKRPNIEVSWWPFSWPTFQKLLVDPAYWQVRRCHLQGSVDFFFIESKGEKMPKILLMVQKSHSQPPFECINPYKWWDFNYQPSTGGNRRISNEPSTVCPPPSFLNQSPEAVAPPKDGAQAFAQIREWCGDGGFMKAERAW